MVFEEHRALPYPEMFPCNRRAGQERRREPEKPKSRQRGPACGGKAICAQRHGDHDWEAASSPSPAAPPSTLREAGGENRTGSPSPGKSQVHSQEESLKVWIPHPE